MSIELLIAFISGGALATLIKSVFDYLKTRSILKNRYNIATILRMLEKTYALMSELKADIGCSRIILAYTSNGGGVPRPGHSLFATILYETYDSYAGPSKRGWENRRELDQNFVKILTKMDTQNLIVVDRKSLEGGVLKDLFTVYGVNEALFAKVKETSTKYYFIVCHFDGNQNIELSSKVKLQNYVEKIKNLVD